MHGGRVPHISDRRADALYRCWHCRTGAQVKQQLATSGDWRSCSTLPSMQCRSQLLVGHKAAEAPTAGSTREAYYGAATALRAPTIMAQASMQQRGGRYAHGVHWQLGFVIGT